MTAVTTAVQPVSVVLNATREHPRELHVERSKHGDYWVGVVIPRKSRHVVIGAASAWDPKDIDITEFARNDAISLCVRGAQFRITRAEADRLVAAFGFEVKKL